MAPFKDTKEMNDRVAKGMAGGVGLSLLASQDLARAIVGATDLAGAAAETTMKKANNNVTDAYFWLSIAIFGFVIWSCWGVVFGRETLHSMNLVFTIAAISCASALFSISQQLSSITRVIPRMNQGFGFVWIVGLVLTAIGVFVARIFLPETPEYWLPFCLFMFHVMPKVLYVAERDSRGACLIQQANGASKEEAEKQWEQIKRELGIRSLIRPGAISFFAIPLALIIIVSV